TVVAHEPPTLYLLPDADHWKSMVAAVGEAYAGGGAFAAMGVFGRAMRPAGETPDAHADGADSADVADGADSGDSARSGDAAAVEDPEVAAAQARQMANLDTFAGYEIPGFAQWSP